MYGSTDLRTAKETEYIQKEIKERKARWHQSARLFIKVEGSSGHLRLLSLMSEPRLSTPHPLLSTTRRPLSTCLQQVTPSIPPRQLAKLAAIATGRRGYVVLSLHMRRAGCRCLYLVLARSKLSHGGASSESFTTGCKHQTDLA